MMILSISVYGIISSVMSEDSTNSYELRTGSISAPTLPGSNLMAKSYNFLSGIEVYKQSGQDIIDITFGEQPRYTTSSTKYEVPSEFKNIPDISPYCASEAETSSVYYASSSALLSQQSKSSSSGYQQKTKLTGTVKEGPASVSASTEITNALMFGHSSMSESGQFNAESGNSWSYSLESKVTLYKAEIDWSADIDQGVTFKFSEALLSDIDALNSDISFKKILGFFQKWGTHVLSKMQTGAFCSQTFHTDAESSKSQAQSYQSQTKSNTQSLLFVSHTSESSSSSASSSSSDSAFSNGLSSVECSGEVALELCGGIAGQKNDPIVTSYEMYPIWQITQLLDYFGDETIDEIDTFFDKLYGAMEECGENKCNGNGLCTLDSYVWSDSFAEGNWDETDFSQLVLNKANLNLTCFCRDGFEGANCDIIVDENCACIGGENCCCDISEDNINTCDGNLICNPKNTCVKPTPTYKCGGWGSFLQCSASEGIVTKVCGSGGNHDCTTHSKQICGSGSANGIGCDFPELASNATEHFWMCSNWGVRRSCQNSQYGSSGVMIGMCGSGANEDCDSKCVGVSAILCADIEDASVDVSNSCHWLSTKSWGTFQECPAGEVMTGYCGSGENYDCNGHAFEWQCCKLKYE